MFKNILFLNQAAGPLFRETAIDLSQEYREQSILYTGHKDTLSANINIESFAISPGPPNKRNTKLSRLLSWLSYTLLAILKVSRCSRETLIFVVSNPPILAIFVFFIAKLMRLRYVVLVYDIHPDVAINLGVVSERNPLVKLWRWANKKSWEGAECVFTIGEVMAENLEKKFDSGKTTLGSVCVIRPWADPEFIKPIKKKNNPLARGLGQQGFLTVLYSGNMGESHDMESMLEAAAMLANQKKIKFLFVGEGEKWPWVKNFVQRNGLENCQVLPFQPEETIPYTLAMADISIVSLDPGAEGLMVPSKTFYYMAAGSAVIGICKGRNDLAHSIEICEAGLTVAPGNPELLASSILSLLENPDLLNQFKNNARRKSIRLYSRSSEVKKLYGAIHRIHSAEE